MYDNALSGPMEYDIGMEQTTAVMEALAFKVYGFQLHKVARP